MSRKQVMDSFFKENLFGFFEASTLLSRNQRQNTSCLFVFFKKAQLYLDSNPMEMSAFEHYEQSLQEFRNQLEIYQNIVIEVLEDDFLINTFVRLEASLAIPENWSDVFLHNFKNFALKPNDQLFYQTRASFQNSSEILGKIVAKSLDLPEESYQACGNLASSFYLLHWFRRIPFNEENKKQFFAKEILKKYNLDNLSEPEIRVKSESFKLFSQEILGLVSDYFLKAEKDFVYILDKHKPILKFLVKYHRWLTQKIKQNPHTIYDKYLEIDSLQAFIWKLEIFFNKTI